MAVYSQATGGTRYLAIRLTLTELGLTNDDIANNRSRIEYKFELYETHDYGSWYNYHDITAYLDLNGSRIGSWTVDHDFSGSGANSKVIASGTYICPHNADGSKSMAFNAVYNIPSNSSNNGSAQISGNFALTTIPRATVPTLSANSVAMGGKVTINTPRASSNFTHKLLYDFAGSGYTQFISGVGESYEWTVPLSLASRIPNGTSGTCTIKCETYNGSTKVGEKTVTLTLTVPSSVKPTVSHTISEAVAGLAAQFGGYIQSKSKVKVVTSSSGAYGSKIQSIKTTFADRTYSDATFTTGFITTYGTLPLVTTVTDSRGRTASVTTNIVVSRYIAPKITRFTVGRGTSSGAASQDGTHPRVSEAWAISPLGNKNTKKRTIKWRRVGTTTWTTSWTETGLYIYDDSWHSNGSILDTPYSYEFVITVEDYFTSVSVSVIVTSAFKLVNYNSSGKGIAFGMMSDKDSFQCAMNAEFYGEVSKSGQPMITKAKVLWTGSPRLTIPITSDYNAARVVTLLQQTVAGETIAIAVGNTPGDTRDDKVFILRPNASLGWLMMGNFDLGYRIVNNQLYLHTTRATGQQYLGRCWTLEDWFP